MAKYLISVTETYRVDTETEAAKIIEEAKVDGKYVLSKNSSFKKERKQKGEIVDEWYKLTLTKVFDDEKEPVGSATIEYNTDGSAF